MSVMLFCAGGSSNSGIGHLMRCQALAQVAEEQHVDSVFWLTQGARELALSRHDWVGKIVLANNEQHSLADDILAYCDTEMPVAIVVDGYDYSEQFLQQLSALPVPLVLMDDILQPGWQYADVICNPAGEQYRLQYEQGNGAATLCLGADFRLLRREFAVTLTLPLHQRISLTINMGGSDPQALTLPVLESVADALPYAPIRVIAGPGMLLQQREALQDFVRRSSCAIQLIENCQDMADVWNNARLAIAAAGGSQFELAACQTPSLLLCVADNQCEATRQAQSQGWCEAFDFISASPVTELTQRVVNLWNDANMLFAMHQRAAEFAVTDGAFNVLNAIAEKRQYHAQ